MRQAMEKRLEFSQTFFAAFVDFKQAFDSVFRPALWELLAYYEVSARTIRLVKDLLNGCESCVRVNGELTPSFPVESGVRQGCPLSPTIFNVAMNWLAGKVQEAAGMTNDRVELGEVELDTFEYADDMVILSETIGSLQLLLNLLADESAALGMQINAEKTNLMEATRGEPNDPPVVSLQGKQLEWVPSFKYLGSVIAKDGSMDEEIGRRIGCAASVFAGLQKAVWSRRELLLRTKLHIYQACVLSILLYGAETWNLTESQSKRLAVFDRKRRRQILKIRWQQHVRNDAVYEKTAQVSPVPLLLKRARLRWWGHCKRMPPERLPKKVMEAEVVGLRPRGRPRQRWIQNIFDDLASVDLTMEEAEERYFPPDHPPHRTRWRALVRGAT